MGHETTAISQFSATMPCPILTVSAQHCHNEPDVLSNQKTDLGSRGDLELLVYDLHGISSGL